MPRQLLIQRKFFGGPETRPGTASEAVLSNKREFPAGENGGLSDGIVRQRLYPSVRK